MSVRELPDTRRGRTFRKLLSIVYVLSIAGITLTLRSAVARLMAVGFEPGKMSAGFVLLNAVLLAGWSLTCWTARRGSRDNRAPPSWVVAAVVILSWAAILVNRA